MTLVRLLLRNLFYHWRGNLAVMFGVAVGTAVLTGALLVGDALRGSLHDLTLQQLEWVEQALVANRFIRADLAQELTAPKVAPTLVFQGSAKVKSNSPEQGFSRRTGRVTILGVDAHFWPEAKVPVNPAFWNGVTGKEKSQDGVVLNEALALDLGVTEKDLVTLYLPKASLVPRESLLGRRDIQDTLIPITLRVQAVLREGEPGNRFTLNPFAGVPRNAFVPLTLLQKGLQQEGKVNAVLVSGGRLPVLQEELGRHLTLDDWNLVIRSPQSRTDELFKRLDRDGNGRMDRAEWNRRLADTVAADMDQDHNGVLTKPEVGAYYQQKHPYLSLESRQLLLEPAIAQAATTAARESGLHAAPTLVYLANSLEAHGEKVPYSLVAALDPGLSWPLGPFLPPGVEKLADDEIVLADWKESPWHIKTGDPLGLTYFEPVVEGQLREVTATFRFRGFIPVQGPAGDPDLTPAFPGITDKLNLSDWDPPFPFDNRRVQPRDERFWKAYHTTPKAFINLARGQQLWGNRFGHLTSVRLSRDPTQADFFNLNETETGFTRRLLGGLRPEQAGLVFEDVRQRSLQASSGGTDFGLLFLSFSCFLIVAALLLVSLLFRLNLDRRATEVGLLLAIGFPRRMVRRLLLLEGLLLAAFGGLLGTLGAMLYARFLLYLLALLWPGGLDHSLLRPHVTRTSLAIGFAATVAMSAVTVLWAVWSLGGIPSSALLAGKTRATEEGGLKSRPRWSRRLALAAALAGLGLLGMAWFVRDREIRSLTFFGSAALLLIASLACIWGWMRSPVPGQVLGYGSWALARLGWRNGCRQPLRSLLTTGLLAFATFLLVAVESFRRQASDDTSSTAGFTLLAESDVPIFQDLNGDEGRSSLHEALERRLRDQLHSSPQQLQEQLAMSQALLNKVTLVPFRLRAGDDASCLNLYQPRRPRLFGVPPSFIKEGSFRFAASLTNAPDQRHNPWLLLEQTLDDGTLPVIGEANTVVWMLKSGLGKDLTVLDESGQEVRLRIVGLLKDSIFQSGLLLSEANFLKLYPNQGGYSFFLIQAPPEQGPAVKTLLETALENHGFEVTPTVDRLAAYWAVENTYLTTFQALGGLGLLMGTIGLAVVLLRSIWERRGELALLRALGYRARALDWLLISENGSLLLLGMGAGTATALLAVMPHLLEGVGQVPWSRLIILLTLALSIGLVTQSVTLILTLRTPLVEALHRE